MSWAMVDETDASKKFDLDMTSIISNDKANVTAPLKPHQPSNEASLHFKRENGWKTKMLSGLAMTIIKKAHNSPQGSILKSESGSMRAANEQ